MCHIVDIDWVIWCQDLLVTGPEIINRKHNIPVIASKQSIVDIRDTVYDYQWVPTTPFDNAGGGLVMGDIVKLKTSLSLEA